MTITMDSNIPSASALISDVDSGLTQKELDEYVDLGYLNRIDKHKEHYAVPPIWINDPASGVLQEITKSVIGHWNKKLQSYVVAVKNLRNSSNSASMNEDHRWLHIDIIASYYTFNPKEGQSLKGTIRKIGMRAAICNIFDVFPSTVFANDEAELNRWQVGDLISFNITSYVHRRKGPVIRAQSLNRTLKKAIQNHSLELGTEDCESKPVLTTLKVVDSDSMHSESGDLDESRPLKKEKKKKKKRNKDVEEEWNDTSINNDAPETAVNHDDSHNLNEYANNETEEEIPSKKRKKKKKSSKDEYS